MIHVEKTNNLRWIVFEKGTPREHRILQQQCEIHETNIGIPIKDWIEWRDIESCDANEVNYPDPINDPRR